MKPELLLPAGDMEKLKFAFQYGADAVYAGVPMFSLRARENKFDIESVKEAVGYTKKLGRKIYLTLNIFPRNNKIPALTRALKPLAKLKPDAFIVADPGVIMLCREIAPEIPLHLSVQANNVNWASAKFWHGQGISRVILSREISLKEIKEIHEKNPELELEFFVHGSICMAYSGRCLLSNYLTYRDANQGTCAHTCRWKYNFYLEEEKTPGRHFQLTEDEHGAYVMNSKDMCLIEYLKDLKDAGICSFKVEGRNKTFYYAATVAKAYRQAVDDMEAGKPFNKNLLKELAKTSNRGFIPGFILDNPAEKAQDYEKSISHQTHEFIGVVRKIRKKGKDSLYEIEVKGRLDAPAECEIITPKDRFTAKISEFKKLDGETLSVIHPGQKDHVLIKLPKKVEAGAILRKEKSETFAG
jgi:putative protease